MDNESFRVIAVVILALAALAAVIRGALLIKADNKTDGSRFMMLGAALLMLTTVVVLLRN